MDKEIKEKLSSDDNQPMVEFYLSPDGNDQNSGTIDQPFKTLEKARESVRNINNQMTGDIIVYLRRGEYSITREFMLNEKDSASNGYKIIYKSYNNERVRLIGGIKISNWKKTEISGIKNLWCAKVPESVKASRDFFVDNHPAIMARSETKKGKGWEELKDDEFEFFNQIETYPAFEGELPIYESYLTTKREMIDWINHEDIEFAYEIGWLFNLCKVEKIEAYNDEKALIKMKMPFFLSAQRNKVLKLGSPSYIQNAFELLSNENEWYFDKKKNLIYYITADGVDLNEKETILATSEHLLTIKGQLDNKVKNIQFEGIDFAYTTDLHLDRIGHNEVQANLLKGEGFDYISHSNYVRIASAIVVDCADSINFYKCNFSKTGSGVIDLQNGTVNTIICGCVFSDIGANGIQIGGFNLEEAHPEDKRTVTKNNLVINCYLHHIGINYKSGVGIISGYADGTRIIHNEIVFVGYSAISVGWGWGYWDPENDSRNFNPAPDHYPRFDQPTICRNSEIRNNHIHHCMQGMHDGGAIYTLSYQPNSVIINNLIHDSNKEPGPIKDGFKGSVLRSGVITGPLTTGVDQQELTRLTMVGGFPGGIYMDEGSGGFTVENNIIYNVVIPINYHEILIKGRWESNVFGENICHVEPHQQEFPRVLAGDAGPEAEFLYLLE